MEMQKILEMLAKMKADMKADRQKGKPTKKK
jgi:hypothetical protein